MENKKAVKQLKALRTFHNQFIEDNKDIENSFSKQLVEALDIAIKALERTALEVPVQEPIKHIENLEKLCKPVADYLKEHYDPHCTVIIAEDYIKLVEDTIDIPVILEN